MHKPDREIEAFACQDPDQMETGVPEYRWLQGNCLRQDEQIHCHMISCQGNCVDLVSLAPGSKGVTQCLKLNGCVVTRSTQDQI